MKAESINENYTSEATYKIAKRNYKTYVKHYKARNLRPMPLIEFLKNYTS